MALVLIHADPMDVADVTPEWGSIQAVSAARYTLITSGTDPRPRGDGSAAPANYRQLDIVNGDNFAGERCEVGANERRYGSAGSPGTFMVYQPGNTYVTYYSQRLAADFPITTLSWQVVMQMKQGQPYTADDSFTGGIPIIAIHCLNSMWQLMGRDGTAMWTAPATLSRWTRFRIEATYTAKAAARIKLQIDDRAGATDFVAQYDSGFLSVPTVTSATSRQSGFDWLLLPGQEIPTRIAMGIYRNSVIVGNTHIDIANVQVYQDVPADVATVVGGNLYGFGGYAAGPYVDLTGAGSIAAGVDIVAVAADSGWSASTPAVTVKAALAQASSGWAAVAPGAAIPYAPAAAVSGWAASPATATVASSPPVVGSGWAASAPAVRAAVSPAVAPLAAGAAAATAAARVAAPAAIAGLQAALPALSAVASLPAAGSGWVAQTAAVGAVAAPPVATTGWLANPPAVSVIQPGVVDLAPAASGWDAAAATVTVTLALAAIAKSVARSDFEASLGGFAFASGGGATGTIVQSQTQAADGLWSLKLDGTLPAASTLVAARKTIALKPWTRYRATVRIYIESITAGVTAATLTLVHNGAGAGQVSVTAPVNRTLVGQWQTVAATFTTQNSPNSPAQAYVESFRFANPGSVAATVVAYADSLSVEELDVVALGAALPTLGVTAAAAVATSGWTANAAAVAVPFTLAAAATGWAAASPTATVQAAAEATVSGWTAQVANVTIFGPVVIGAPAAAASLAAQVPAVTVQVPVSAGAYGWSATPPLGGVSRTYTFAGASAGWQAWPMVQVVHVDVTAGASAWNATAPAVTVIQPGIIAATAAMMAWTAAAPTVARAVSLPGGGTGWAASPPQVAAAVTLAVVTTGLAAQVAQVKVAASATAGPTGWTGRPATVTVTAPIATGSTGWTASAPETAASATLALPASGSGWTARPVVASATLAAPAAATGWTASPPLAAAAAVFVLPAAGGAWTARPAVVTVSAAAPLAAAGWAADAPAVAHPGLLALAPAASSSWQATPPELAAIILPTASSFDWAAAEVEFAVGAVSRQVGLLDYRMAEPVLVATASLDPWTAPETFQGLTGGLDTYTPRGIDPP